MQFRKFARVPVLRRYTELITHYLILDSIAVAAALYGGLLLRVGWDDLGAHLPVLDKCFGLFLALRIGTFYAMGMYNIIWRYFSIRDVVLMAKAVFASSLLIIATTYLVDIGRIPRATFFIDGLLLLSILGAVRFIRRVIHEHRSESMIKETGRRTIIIGAGSNGRGLAHRFRTDEKMGFQLVGFIDDDPKKVGCSVSGVKILGTTQDLASIVKKYALQEVVVAISDPEGSLLRETVQTCRPYNIRPRMIRTHMAGRSSKRMDVCREIELHDLLNRPRRIIDVKPLTELIRNRRVLVTGAGGSIGSELARQIYGFGPAQLLLLDHSEYNLYQIDHELRVSPQDTSSIVPLLVDIKDRDSLEQAFIKYRPELVFHAAAYKHVHLVEANPYSAILNNVLGTRHLLDLSEQTGVQSFLLISSDKAVNPAGVMGATKRICELMVIDSAQRTNGRYTSVRFGNVLGSSGSLIPLLQKQIQEENLVTITHKDMTRYFMLIPEAVSLVLRAASIAEPGDITVLRMGDPVKIVDIAKSLIALMGKTENEVSITFTGLRPGEKLFEELYLNGNELNTEDPDILVVPKGDSAVAEKGLRNRVSRLIELSQAGDAAALGALHDLVPSHYLEITRHFRAPIMPVVEAWPVPTTPGTTIPIEN